MNIDLNNFNNTQPEKETTVIPQPTVQQVAYPYVSTVPAASSANAAKPSGRRAKLDDAASSVEMWTLGIIALVFGILYSRLIFHGGFGLGAAAVTLLFPIIFYPFIIRKGTKIRPAGFVMAVPLLALAASFVLNASLEGRFWRVIALIALFMLQSTLLAGCTDAPALSLRSMTDSFVTHTIFAPANISGSMSALFKKSEKTKAPSTAAKLAAGLVISIPVAAILVAVFCSADAAFGAITKKILDSVKFEFGKFVWDIVLGAMLCVYFIPLVLTLRSGFRRENSKNKTKHFLDPVISATVLAVSSLVYILFVAVQFRYFFAGQLASYFGNDFSMKLELPNGMTWAEYARSGFFELSGIIVVTFAAVAFFAGFCRRSEKGVLPLAMRVALSALSLCNVAIIASAVLRMLLYTKWCGLTARRVAVLTIIAFITLSLIVLIVKLWWEGLKAFRIISAIAIAAMICFSLMNVDALCARVNVSRHLDHDTSIDMDYLGQLSFAAAPSVERLMNESEDRFVRDAAEGLLAKYYFNGDGGVADRALKDMHAGQWTLDHWNALRIYEKSSPRESYIIRYNAFADYQRHKTDYERWNDGESFITFTEYAQKQYNYLP